MTAHRPQNVLIVEDDPDISGVVTTILEDEGWNVRQARDGAQAVELIHKYRPDIIVLDLSLPILNGEDFMTLLRFVTNIEHVRIIVMTAKSTYNEQELRENGVERIIRKPFDIYEFIELMRGLNASGPNATSV